MYRIDRQESQQLRRLFIRIRGLNRIFFAWCAAGRGYTRRPVGYTRAGIIFINHLQAPASPGYQLISVFIGIITDGMYDPVVGGKELDHSRIICQAGETTDAERRTKRIVSSRCGDGAKDQETIRL